jgi:hypothetical protein
VAAKRHLSQRGEGDCLLLLKEEIDGSRFECVCCFWAKKEFVDDRWRCDARNWNPQAEVNSSSREERRREGWTQPLDSVPHRRRAAVVESIHRLARNSIAQGASKSRFDLTHHPPRCLASASRIALARSRTINPLLETRFVWACPIPPSSL